MESRQGGGHGGIGFLGALGILFIGLRLAGLIDWPWWLVLSPLWGGALLWLIAVAVVVVAAVSDESRRWRR